MSLPFDAAAMAALGRSAGTLTGTLIGNAAPALGAAANPETGQTTLDVIRVFVVLVGVAALVTSLAQRIKLPYTVALVAFGILAGAAFSSLRVEITPQLVLVVLVPALIFDAAYRIDFAKLRPSLLGVGLLAGPGVLVTAGVVAAFLHYGAGLAPIQAFIVGAMLAATDPAAVIATFKRLNSPRRLSTLVEAESLFNDGTGIVAFTLAVGFATAATSPVEIGVSFVSVVVVSAVIGAATGLLASRVLPNVGDHLIELSLSVVLAYGTYLAADAIHQSGVIATATAAMVLGNYVRHRAGVSIRTEDALDTVWEFAAFVATAFVFLVVGFAISLRSLAVEATAVAWAVAACLFARAIIVYGFLGGLRQWRRWSAGRRAGDDSGTSLDAGRPAKDTSETRSKLVEPNEGDMPAAWLHVIYWSGLRGAISTALALSLPADLPDRAELQAITFGVVLFTLLVQATTAELVVDRWGQKPARSPGRPKKSNRPRRSTSERAVAPEAAEPAPEAGNGPTARPAEPAPEAGNGPTAPPAEPRAQGGVRP